jgi:tryptophan halogenase
MDAGWCWRIPVEGEDHRGYVFSSAHITEQQARDEMRDRNPRLGETWTVRFRSGRHQDFWKGNTVAIGNAYGFVEPLESTALHMVIAEVRCLLRCLDHAGGDHWDRALANRSVGEHWDYLRWFLAVHYKYNQKKDTRFWRDARELVDVSGIQPLIERLQATGPEKEAGISPYAIPDPVFNYHGVVTMLLGQKVQCPRPTNTWLSKAQWDSRVAECHALVGRALPQADALELLRRRPEFLENIVSPKSRSWIIPRSSQAEYLKVPGFWSHGQTASTRNTTAHRNSVPYAHLLASVAQQPTEGAVPK